MGGVGEVTFVSQAIGTGAALIFALVAGFTVYTIVDKTIGLRLTAEEEAMGSDLAIHNIDAYPEESIGSEGR